MDRYTDKLNSKYEKIYGAFYSCNMSQADYMIHDTGSPINNLYWTTYTFADDVKALRYGDILYLKYDDGFNVILKPFIKKIR